MSSQSKDKEIVLSGGVAVSHPLLSSPELLFCSHCHSLRSAALSIESLASVPPARCLGTLPSRPNNRPRVHSPQDPSAVERHPDQGSCELERRSTGNTLVARRSWLRHRSYRLGVRSCDWVNLASSCCSRKLFRALRWDSESVGANFCDMRSVMVMTYGVINVLLHLSPDLFARDVIVTLGAVRLSKPADWVRR